MNEYFEYLRKQETETNPQLLGIVHEGAFYHFILQTFHLNEEPKPFLKGLPQEHSHNVFHIVFYTAESGESSFMLDGSPAASKPLMMVLLPPGVPHCFAQLEDRFSCYHEITFSLIENREGKVFCGDFEGLFRKYGGGNSYKVPRRFEFSKSKAAFIEHHYGRIAGALGGGRGAGRLFQAYANIASFIFFLMNEFSSAPPERQGNSSPALELAREYIERNYVKNPGLEDIASAAGISREHLCRSFKKHYGVNPVEYSNTLRSAAAEQLLLNSSLSISEISARLGYSDIYSFSKSFKKASGRPPGKFRSSAN